MSVHIDRFPNNDCELNGNDKEYILYFIYST